MRFCAPTFCGTTLPHTTYLWFAACRTTRLHRFTAPHTHTCTTPPHACGRAPHTPHNPHTHLLPSTPHTPRTVAVFSSTFTTHTAVLHTCRARWFAGAARLLVLANIAQTRRVGAVCTRVPAGCAPLRAHTGRRVTGSVLRLFPSSPRVLVILPSSFWVNLHVALLLRDSV